MKKYILTFAFSLIALMLFGAIGSNAQPAKEVEKEFKHAMTQARNSSGRDFYCAFPMNDNANATQQNIAIYITSSVNTTATISNPYLGLNITKNVKAYEITEFSSAKGGLGWDAEIRDFEKVLNQGMHITSPDPISVYAMNSKTFTSEGYLAIPTNYWGTDYIHNSFYDFKEQPNVDWGAGFTVIAKEDFTTVRISLVDGKNKVAGFGQTTSGKEHGATWNVLLMAGQVYSVQGDGKTRGIFDISGSIVTSDKPIGMISYHNRCMIPATVVNNGRDHLIEMMPPVQAWGKNYATVEYARGSDKGDFFRVVAGEDNTTFSISWYEKGGGGDNKLISTYGPLKLQKKGDWYEYNGKGATDPHQLESIRGVSIFTADKPILVMQYSYSANYDNSPAYDPFMILVTPVEQYTKETVFQTPSNYGNNDFRDNYFNIIAIGDNEDPDRHQKLMRSITLDDKKVTDLSPAFAGNRIPGTNLYWAFISDLPQGTHKLKGDTPFGGYIYGFAQFDSYGWPAATAFGNLSEIDTLPPIVTFPPGCFEWIVTNEDDPENERNGKEGDDPRQVDVGVREMPKLMPGSFNFDEPVYIDENGNEAVFSGKEPNYNFRYKIKVTDPFQDAQANLRVIDDVGNFTDTVIYYSVDKIAADPDPIKFGRVRVKSTGNELVVTISNPTTEDVEITNIELRQKKVYTILTDVSFLPMVLTPGQDTTVTLSYTPVKEYKDLNANPELQFDFDTLAVKTGCLDWEFAIDGQGIQPEIRVENYNAGQAQVGQFTLSNNNTLDDGVFITNDGTEDLIVTGLKLVVAPFTLPNMPAGNINADVVTFTNPITVPSGGAVNRVKFGHDLDNEFLIQFTPFSTLNADNTIDVIFVSNAAEDENNDSISTWFGTALQSGPNVIGDIFEDTRVDGVSAQTKYAYITNKLPEGVDPNSGTVIPVLLKTIRLEANDGNFIMHPTEKIQGFNDRGDLIRNDLSTATSEQLYVEGTDNPDNKVSLIKVPVLFTPKAEGLLTDNVIVEFADSEKSILKGEMRGQGFLPEIDVTNQTFAPTLINQGISPEQGEIVIKNVTTPVDAERDHIIIKSIELDNTSPAAANYINFVVKSTGQTIDQIQNLRLEKDESIIINYDFLTDAATTGDKIARLKVLSDAGPAIDQQEPTTDNSHLVDFNGIYEPDNQNGFDDGGYIVGELYAEGVEAVGYDWGTISACNALPQTITITNTSSSVNPTTEIIKDIVRDGGTIADEVFEFTSNYIGVPLNSGESHTVDVKFKNNTPAGVYNTTYKVIFEPIDGVSKEAPFNLEGTLLEDRFRVELKQFPNIKPGDVINLDVNITAINNSRYQTAEINDVTVNLLYKPEWLIYQDEYENGNLTNWNDVRNTKQNLIIGGETWVEHSFTLDAADGDLLTGNGVLFSPKFMYLLHEATDNPDGVTENIIVPEIDAVAFNNSRGNCVTTELVDGLITSEFCIQRYRALDFLFIGDEEQQLAPISPNPVQGTMNLDFTVGSNANVTLEITNLDGEMVKVLMDAPLSAGQYETTANVSDLPSGTYFLTYKYLGVKETQKIVIAK